MPGRIYKAADADVLSMMAEITEKHHPDLVEAAVRVSVLMVLPPTNKDGNPTGPAILHHGVEAVACIGKVSRKDRVHKKFDAEMQIDQVRWSEIETDENSQRAIIDHELTHLVVRRDSSGSIMQDDDLRPLLALRPDDWTLTGFRSVVDRYGEDAIEHQALRRLYDQHGQALFPWALSGASANSKACAKCGKVGETLTTLATPGRKETPPLCLACFEAAGKALAEEALGRKKRRAG